VFGVHGGKSIVMLSSGARLYVSFWRVIVATSQAYILPRYECDIYFEGNRHPPSVSHESGTLMITVIVHAHGVRDVLVNGTSARLT